MRPLATLYDSPTSTWTPSHLATATRHNTLSFTGGAKLALWELDLSGKTSESQTQSEDSQSSPQPESTSQPEAGGFNAFLEQSSSPRETNQSKQPFGLIKRSEISIPEKLVCLAWGKNQQDTDRGLLAGGLMDGQITVWNVDSVLNGENSPATTLDKHEKEVKGIEFNPKQPGLMASVGADGNVFFWNLKNLNKPSTIDLLGKNPHTNEDVTSLAWNHVYDSILATCSSEGLCVVWELKEKKHMLRFNSQNRSSYSCIAWNPELPNELALASQDNSVVELWDLRKAYAPRKELKGHTDGILGLSWCPHDSNLLLSCGKDGKCLIWNPNNAEKLGELPSSDNWVYDVKWSYRPSILLTSTYDPTLSVYSLQDSSADNHISSDKRKGVADSTVSKSVFKTAPKWLHRPVSASFGFGGRLVTVSNNKNEHRVKIHSVKFDDQLVQQSSSLEQVLKERNFEEFCRSKAADTDEEEEKSIWSVIGHLFNDRRTDEMLKFLGYDANEAEKATSETLPESSEEQVDPLHENYLKYDQDKVDELLRNYVITANWSAACDLCILAGRFTDALILAPNGGDELWNRVRNEYLKKQSRPTMSLVGMMLSDIEGLVNTSELDNWKQTLAILCSYGSSNFVSLVTRLGERLEEDGQNLPAIICYLCAGSFEKTVAIWLKNFQRSSDKKNLVSLMEKVVVFQQVNPPKQALPGGLLEKYAEYASLLASQGQLDTSLRYLNIISDSSPQSSLSRLKHRIYHSMFQPIGEAPPTPWQTKSPGAPQRQMQHRQPTQQQQPKPMQQSSYPQPTQQPQQQFSNTAYNQQPSYQSSHYVDNRNSLPSQPQTQTQPNYYANQGPDNFDQSRNTFSQQSSGYTTSQVVDNRGQTAGFKPSFVPSTETSMSTQQHPTQEPVSKPAPQPSKPGEPIANFGVGQGNVDEETTKESTTTEPEEPVGDMSAISEENRAIVEILETNFNFAFKEHASSLSEVDQKKERLIRKDLNILMQQLNRGSVSQEIVEELHGLTKHIGGKQFKEALSNVRTLASTYRDSTKDWVKGVKFLCQILKQLS